MEMTGMDFRNALLAGKRLYGTLVTSSSPRSFDTICSLGPDFVFFCTEHIFYNTDTLGWMCRAYRSAGINPVVRILRPDPFLATQALDSGACTILAPYTEDIDEVRELIGAVRYRPLRGRKLKNILAGKESLTNDMAGYLRNHNRNNSLLLNVESPEGVMNMKKFLSFETIDGTGVDGIVIGPHDLSVSHEIPENYYTAEFLDLCSSIIRETRTSGHAAGGHNGSRNSIALQEEWIKAGANLIIHSSDIYLFADRYAEDMKRLRKLAGDVPAAEQKDESV